MKFEHEYLIHTPMQKVVDFHRESLSMSAITPPPIKVKFLHAPQLLAEGDEIAFTLWFGPLPLHWLARIEDVSTTGFVDRQLTGPFKEWVHSHTFVPIDENTTKVVDQIYACLHSQPLLGLVGRMMWMGMPLLFFFRSWKTRRLLERTDSGFHQEACEAANPFLDSQHSKGTH